MKHRKGWVAVLIISVVVMAGLAGVLIYYEKGGTVEDIEQKFSDLIHSEDFATSGIINESIPATEKQNQPKKTNETLDFSQNEVEKPKSNGTLSEYYDRYETDYLIMYAYDTGDTSVLDSEDAAVYQVVSPKIAEIKQTYTDSFYQEKAAHDFICDRCMYIENEHDQTAYGTLVLGKAVCEGYARAFEICMDMLGIENQRVDSYADNHAWNLVKLSGEWYLIDVTWDDQEAETNYLYFNITDRQHDDLETEHDIANNSGKYNYYKYVYQGAVFNDFNNEYFNFVNTKYQQGIADFTVIIYSKDGDATSILNNFAYSNENTPHTVAKWNASYYHTDYYIVINMHVTYR